MWIHVLGADYDGYVESMPGATGAEFSLLPPENATGNYVKVVQRLPVRIRFKGRVSPDVRLRPACRWKRRSAFSKLKSGTYTSFPNSFDAKCWQHAESSPETRKCGVDV